MRDILLTAPGVLSQVTPPSANRAQRCLNLVIKWAPAFQMWQDAVPDIHCRLISLTKCLISSHGNPYGTRTAPTCRERKRLTAMKAATAKLMPLLVRFYALV
jgi:hypothetical protein